MSDNCKHEILNYIGKFNVPVCSECDKDLFQIFNQHESQIKLLLDDKKSLEERIEQYRGALGYAVPAHIKEDPTIINGLSDAAWKQVKHIKAQLSIAVDALEQMGIDDICFSIAQEALSKIKGDRA